MLPVLYGRGQGANAPSDYGQSTSVYSLVVLGVTIVGLGLEYPLLKKTSTQGAKIVGTSLIIEVIVTIAVPLYLS